jgi:hypothetical protein
MVRFKWSVKWGGETVALSGTFNNWEEVGHMPVVFHARIFFFLPTASEVQGFVSDE